MKIDFNYLIVLLTALFAGLISLLRSYDEGAVDGLSKKKATAKLLLASLSSAGYVIAFYEILNYFQVAFGVSLAIAGALSCASGNLTGRIIVALTEKFLSIKIEEKEKKD